MSSYSGGIMTTTRFFVYGSFCEGMIHFSKIQNYVQSFCGAQIKASAYRLKVGYPVVLKEGEDWIEGQIVEMKKSDILLAMMDEFFGYNSQDPEAGLHVRRLVDVYDQDRMTSQPAWVYFLNPHKMPVQAFKIEDGDWKKSLQEYPPLTSQLTDKQKSYITRLAQSTGREIVPIDLSLYRELMSLELIIDKGRRLALSKLGQEVYRYLA